MNSVLERSTAGFHRSHLRRIGGIQHVQLREAGLSGKGFRQHFRPEARSAHAEHHGVGEFLPLHALRKILVVGDIGGGRATQPAQPFVLVVAGPDRLVLLPEFSDFCRSTPFLGALLDRLGDAGAERQLLPVDAAAERGRALVGHCAIELVGGVGELLDAVLDQFGSDGVERDARLLELFEHVPCFLDFSSRLSRSLPWSRNASSVAGGTVLTVLGPISSST